MSYKRLSLYVILISLLSPMAYAAEFYGLWGLGVNQRASNYQNVDAQTQIAPFIMGGYGNIGIEANRGSYTFYKDGTWFASAVGYYRSPQGLSADDAKKLGVDERKASVDAGLQIGRRLGGGFVTRLALLQDISGAHQSQELDWQVYRHDDIGPIRLLSSLGLQYQAQGLSNYYFGTDNYRVDAAPVAELELIATYEYKHMGLFLGTRAFQYSDTVITSPIVDGGLSYQLFSGLAYVF